MRPKKDKLSISIDADIHEILRERAELDARSLSQLINVILRNWVKMEGLSIDGYSVERQEKVEEPSAGCRMNVYQSGIRKQK